MFPLNSLNFKKENHNERHANICTPLEQSWFCMGMTPSICQTINTTEASSSFKDQGQGTLIMSLLVLKMLEPEL